MNKLVSELQDVIEKKANNDELRQELSSLVKMLKLGFLSKPVGMEKVSKVYASNDAKKIKQFYDTFGSQINAMKLAGSFDLFATYMSVEYGITVAFESDEAPNIFYAKKGKKLQKFQDLYNEYFIEPAPRSPQEAATKILKALEALTKDFVAANEAIKEELKGIIESQSDLTPDTVKAVDRILTKSRIKAIVAEELAAELDHKISQQQKAVDIILEDGTSEDTE